MWGIIKGIGVGVGILLAWLLAKGYETQREQEASDRVVEGLQDISLELYGQPFPELDEQQKEEVFRVFNERSKEN